MNNKDNLFQMGSAKMGKVPMEILTLPKDKTVKKEEK